MEVRRGEVYKHTASGVLKEDARCGEVVSSQTRPLLPQ